MEDLESVIYFCVNLINNKIYVGKTEGFFSKRKRIHLNHARRGYPNLLDRSINKHGEKNFSWFFIQYPKKDLNDKEIYWIKILDTLIPNGFNISSGGGSGFSGASHYNTTRQILSQKSMGNTSAANRINKKKILFIDPQGNNHIVQNNFNDFCRANNLAIRTISSHLNGQRSTDNIKGWKIYALDELGNKIPNKICNTSRIRYCLVNIKTNKEYILERDIESFCKENDLCVYTVRKHANTFKNDVIYRDFKIYQLDTNGNKIPKTFI
jgi:group I intron endonuclease